MLYDNSNIGFLGCFLIIILCLALSALGGFIFMLLWNWLIPLFWTAAPILTFWQAWGCLILIGWISSLFRK